MKRDVLKRGFLKTLFLMRLTLIIILIAAIQLSAKDTRGQKLTYNKKDITIRELFREIKRQTGYNVVSSDGSLNPHMPIDVNFYKTPLEKVFDQILFGTAVTYQFLDKNIVIKIDNRSLRERGIGMLTKIDVRGRVLDENNKPLVGAVVKVKGTKTIVATDSNGEFSLKGVDDKAILTISFLGYETLEIKGSESSNSIKLALSNDKLQEVEIVSTGYQNIPKERATGSFTVIDNKLLNRAVSPDLITRLNGVTNGLLVSKNGNLTIRGRSTIFSQTYPLIVVDNFPYEGDINLINPNDIENVTILKDAAAASIWGVRASNGVIVITTKRGIQNRKASINFNVNLTVGGKPDLYYQPQLSSTEFIDVEKFLFEKGAYSTQLLNDYTTISPVIALLQKAKLTPTYTNQAKTEIDALRELDNRAQLSEYFFRRSTRQQYYINVNGGSTDQTYFFSAGYDKNLPTEVSSTNSRLTIKGNNIYNLFNNKLKLLTDITLTKSNNKNTNSNSYTPYLPYEQVADLNGTPLATLKSGGLRAAYTDTAGKGGLLDWKYRPLDELRNENSTANSNGTDYRILVGVDLKISSPLSLSVNYQYFNSNIKIEQSNNQLSFYTRNRINEVSKINSTTSQVTRPIPLGDIYTPSFIRNEANYGRAQLNFKQKFSSKHDINAIVGYEIRDDHSNTNSYTLYGYFPETATNSVVDVISPLPLYNGSGTSRIGNTSSQSGSIDRYISYYANASYVYDSKYTLSGSYRKDESNIFGVRANQKGVPLWSTGILWNIYKESFFNIDWMSTLNVKATYGYNGNVNKSVSAYLTAQSSGPSPIYSGANYATIINPPNDDLRWERVKNLNLGIDFSSQNNVISGSFEYYIKNGIDLIGSSPIAPQSGVTLYTGNSANTHTNGVDIQISTKNINRQFKWMTTAIFNYARDKITTYKVNPGTNFNVMLAGIKPIVGYPISSIFSYKWNGLDAIGDPLGELNGIVSKDYTSIANLTDYSQLNFHGSAIPTTFGSIRNTFTYKNLEISMNITYQFNYYFRRNSLNISNLFSGGYQQTDYPLRWQKPGDELLTSTPAITYPANISRDNFYQYSSVLIEKGDHVRLQDIQLNYTINKSTVAKFPFSNLNLYCYMANIGILWRANKKSLDPDVVSTYPNPKTIAFGLKANF